MAIKQIGIQVKKIKSVAVDDPSAFICRFGQIHRGNPVIVADANCVHADLSQLSSFVFLSNSTKRKSETRSPPLPARSTIWHPGSVEPKQKPIQPTESRMQVQQDQSGEFCR